MDSEAKDQTSHRRSLAEADIHRRAAQMDTTDSQAVADNLADLVDSLAGFEDSLAETADNRADPTDTDTLVGRRSRPRIQSLCLLPDNRPD